MDEKKKRGLKIASGLTIQYTKKEMDLPAMVMEKVSWIEQTYGPRFKPIKILFGPDEYIWLMEWTEKHPYFGAPSKQVNLIYPNTFMGFEIGLKQSPGIELELPVENVFLLAKGRVKLDD